MGKRVDILVVDGLDGLEELGVFGVVFFFGVLGLDGIRGWSDALQVHVDDGPVNRPGKEQELKMGEAMLKADGRRKEGTEERNHDKKKEKISPAFLLRTVGQIRQALSRLLPASTPCSILVLGITTLHMLIENDVPLIS